MRWVGDPRDSLRGFGLLYGAVGACGLLLLRLGGAPIARLLRCPLYAATGIPCPGCGGTHAALALAGGDVPAALRANALVALALLAWVGWAALALLVTLVPRLRGRPQLGRRERLMLRLSAAAAVGAQWGWLVAQRVS